MGWETGGKDVLLNGNHLQVKVAGGECGALDRLIGEDLDLVGAKLGKVLRLEAVGDVREADHRRLLVDVFLAVHFRQQIAKEGNAVVIGEEAAVVLIHLHDALAELVQLGVALH